MLINRQRQLPGEDFTNIALVSLPATRRILAKALRMMSDPAGRGVMNPTLIRKEAWQAGPEGAEWPTLDEVETFVLELAEIGWLRLYPNPGGPGELFQILARWPRVDKEGDPKHPPPPAGPPPAPAITRSGSIRTAAVERAGEGESERAGESAGGGERPSGSSQHPPEPGPGVRLPPPRFCRSHRGGPPDDVDCRNCGTMRGRNERHGELKAARVRALGLPPLERAMMLRAIDDEMREIEEAAAAALLGPRPGSEDPTEYIDEHGRVETT